MNEKDIKITIPFELAGKLSKKIKEVGFDTIAEYVIYVLEQALSNEKVENEMEGEEEKDVRKRLKELGYL